MALAFYVLAAPAGAACGKVYAHINGFNEEAFSVLAALFLPIGLFCAINLLLKD